MSAAPDCIVLGSDVEGLVAAATLARAGRRTLVLEEGPRLGGRSAHEEFHPGFRTAGLLPDASLARRSALEPLGLERFGLAWRRDEPALLVPDKSGCPLLFQRDPARLNGELPAQERERLAALATLCSRAAPMLAALVDAAPPDPATPASREALSLATTALRLRLLGRDEALSLARILPSSACDWLEDSLGMEAVRVALTAPALSGTVLGPRAPGTSAFVFLRQALGGPGPAGGPAALARALVELCRSGGVELRTDSAVRSLLVGAGGIEGVELESGERLSCRAVLSTFAPVRTLLELVPAGTLSPSVERAAQSFRARGTTAVLHLALSAPPVFAGREKEPIERAVGATSLMALERAADGLKYGDLPTEPWVEVHVPSRSAPDLAPTGAAVATVLCHTVPTHPAEGGWSDANRARLAQVLLAGFEALAPGAGKLVVGQALLTPPDIAARYRTPGGHVHDGELALDQLWLQRPSLVLSRYATPVRGLVLGGAGSHPGGPFLARAGALAAQSLLRAAP